MRANIFTILKNNTNLKDDAKRIYRLITKESIIVKYNTYNMTLENFVDNNCFRTWAGRGHCIDLDDFKQTINFNSLLRNLENFDEDNTEFINSFVTYLEYSTNLLCLADSFCSKYEQVFKRLASFNQLFQLLNDSINILNLKLIEDKENNIIYLIENKPEVTAVAEIEKDKDLAWDILRYNHLLLKGNIDEKCKILASMGKSIEQQRKRLEQISDYTRQLSSTIFGALNNFDIRHDNCTFGNSDYHEKIDSMSKTELENCYDELYQLILLAKLELDNVERVQKMKALLNNVVC